MILQRIVFSIFFCLFTSWLSAEESKGIQHIASSEGRVLPKNVFRTRVVNKSVTGSTGFDKKGNKTADLGQELDANVTAFALEYGMTDKFTIYAMLPIVTHNNLVQDDTKFLQSDLYKQHFNGVIKKLSDNPEFRGAMGCHDFASCRQLIENGEHFVAEKAIPLPTGELTHLSADTPIKDTIQKTILKARPQAQGKVGIGDMEVGGLYNFYASDRMRFSTGAGLRLPTGENKVSDKLHPLSASGMVTSAVRVNFDVSPFDGLWVSFQDHMEYSLTSTEWNRPSDVDGKQFSKADPKLGDGKPNIRTLEKRGIYNQASVKADFGLGVLASVLKSLSVNTAYKFDSRQASLYDKEIQEIAMGIDTGRSSFQHVSFGGLMSGIPYGVPLSAEVSYDMPVAGENVILANHDFTVALHGYLKF